MGRHVAAAMPGGGSGVAGEALRSEGTRGRDAPPTSATRGRASLLTLSAFIRVHLWFPLVFLRLLCCLCVRSLFGSAGLP